MLLSLVAKGSRPGASVHTLTNWVSCYNFRGSNLLVRSPHVPRRTEPRKSHPPNLYRHPYPRSTSAVSEAADFHTISYSADMNPAV
jgi:hypothetical protein